MKLLSLALLLPFSMLSMNKVDRSLIRSSDRLGEMGLSFDSEGFIVKNQGKKTRVHNYDVDKSLRGMNAQRLEAIKKAGAAIAITKLSNGEFSLRMNPNLNGGGIWLGQAMYHVTKIACWSGVSAAATATISALAPTAAAGAVGTTVLAEKVGSVAVATGNIIVEKLGEKAVQEAAVMVGTQMATNSALAPALASLGALSAGIEAVSLTAGAAGTAIWWLP